MGRLSIAHGLLAIRAAYRIILAMEWPRLTPGRFVRRENRFRVTVEVTGKPVGAHLPNSGRLTELLTPGRRCWLIEFQDPRRKTRFDAVLVRYAGTWVSVDARLPNKLLSEALATGALGPFRRYDQVRREVRLGDSRLDMRLAGPPGICWIEIKSVTLVEDGVARFPDAPTARGARHVRELMGAVAAGDRAAVVFVIQRGDARRFRPHDQADPEFGAVLREASRAGVDIHAWTCRVDRQHIEIDREIPVDLHSEGVT